MIYVAASSLLRQPGPPLLSGVCQVRILGGWATPKDRLQRRTRSQFFVPLVSRQSVQESIKDAPPTDKGRLELKIERSVFLQLSMLNKSQINLGISDASTTVTEILLIEMR
jgi:hypothetical protein